ncbi:MAG: DUF6788 family protein [Pseudonocardiaceae bacterium]
MAETTTLRLSAAQRRRQQRVIAALAAVDLALPGSIQVRRTRCGNPRCACHGEPARLHGPYIVWTRKVAQRTVTKVLTEEQFAALQPMLDNSRRLRSSVAELQELTLEIVEAELIQARS